MWYSSKTDSKLHVSIILTAAGAAVDDGEATLSPKHKCHPAETGQEEAKESLRAKRSNQAPLVKSESS